MPNAIWIQPQHAKGMPACLAHPDCSVQLGLVLVAHICPLKIFLIKPWLASGYFIWGTIPGGIQLYPLKALSCCSRSAASWTASCLVDPIFHQPAAGAWLLKPLLNSWLQLSENEA